MKVGKADGELAIVNGMPDGQSDVEFQDGGKTYSVKCTFVNGKPTGTLAVKLGKEVTQVNSPWAADGALESTCAHFAADTPPEDPAPYAKQPSISANVDIPEEEEAVPSTVKSQKKKTTDT